MVGAVSTRLLLLVPLALAVPARSAAVEAVRPTDARVTGTVTCLERMAFPSDAVVTVVLEDVSRADAPAKTIAQETLRPSGQVPLRFTLTFDGSIIEPRHRYVVRARITDGAGRLLFRSAGQNAVLTQGGRDTVDVLVRRVGGQPAAKEAAPKSTEGKAEDPGPSGPSAPAAESLEGAWVVTFYNNGKAAVVAVLAETELTLRFDDVSVSGSAGCNGYHGSFRAGADTLALSPMSSTRKACARPDGVMEQEGVFLAALATTAAWQVTGGTLELRRADGALAVAARRR